MHNRHPFLLYPDTIGERQAPLAGSIGLLFNKSFTCHLVCTSFSGLYWWGGKRTGLASSPKWILCSTRVVRSTSLSPLLNTVLCQFSNSASLPVFWGPLQISFAAWNSGCRCSGTDCLAWRFLLTLEKYCPFLAAGCLSGQPPLQWKSQLWIGSSRSVVVLWGLDIKSPTGHFSLVGSTLLPRVGYRASPLPVPEDRSSEQRLDTEWSSLSEVESALRGWSGRCSIAVFHACQCKSTPTHLFVALTGWLAYTYFLENVVQYHLCVLYMDTFH